MNDDSYLIHNPSVIISNLSSLIKKQCLMNVEFGENNSFLTTLIGIDKKKNALFFDVSPSDYSNRKLLSSYSVHFSTGFSGIQVAFTTHKASKTIYQGETAFTIAIPKSLFWRNRREYYRVKMPAAKVGYCEITSLTNSEPVKNLLTAFILKAKTKLTIEEIDEKRLEFTRFRLFDVSLSGFSFINDLEELSSFFEVNELYQNCLLLLKDEEPIKVHFQLANKIYNEKHKNEKLGCKFVDLSPVLESKILRYIQLLEVAMKK